MKPPTSLLGLAFGAAAGLFAQARAATTPPPPAPARDADCAAEYQDDEFQIRLGGDWRRVAGTDPEQVTFASAALKSRVVISVIQAAVPADRLLDAAQALADARTQAEVEADPARVVTFGDRWTELKAPGELGHVAYAGYDNRGLIFRFMGWTTRAKILSLWVGTETRDNAQSKRVFEEVFKGFRFTVP